MISQVTSIIRANTPDPSAAAEPILLEVDRIFHLACPASPPHYRELPCNSRCPNINISRSASPRAFSFLPVETCRLAASIYVLRRSCATCRWKAKRQSGRDRQHMNLPVPWCDIHLCKVIRQHGSIHAYRRVAGSDATPGKCTYHLAI
jgi:hypothetical protein